MTTDQPQYFVATRAGLREGPFTWGELLSRQQAGSYPNDSLVWMDGWEKWKNLDEFVAEKARNEAWASMPPLDQVEIGPVPIQEERGRLDLPVGRTMEPAQERNVLPFKGYNLFRSEERRVGKEC